MSNLNQNLHYFFICENPNCAIIRVHHPKRLLQFTLWQILPVRCIYLYGGGTAKRAHIERPLCLLNLHVAASKLKNELSQKCERSLIVMSQATIN